MAWIQIFCCKVWCSHDIDLHMSRQKKGLFLETNVIQQLKSSKNWFFPLKKYFLNFFWLFLPLFNATFQCRRYNIFKKILNLFFAHENLKKQASKVAYNRPQMLLFTAGLGMGKIDFSYYKYVCPKTHLSPYLWQKATKYKCDNDANLRKIEFTHYFAVQICTILFPVTVVGF